MINLIMWKACEAPGCGRFLNRMNMPAFFANFFTPQACPKFQRSQTTFVGGGLYGNKYDFGTAVMRKQVQHCGNISAGGSHMSTSAGLQTVDSLTFPKRLAVEIGALLKIDLSRTTAGINATAGDNLEEISIQPVWTERSDKVAEWKSLNISHSQNRVSLEQSKSLDQRKIHLSKLLELNVQIPARWCSLDIQASEGPVYVQNVREGTVRVTTAGGDVKLGEVKGGEAHVESHGGEFQAKVLQASTCVSTVGGKLSVDKLQGDIIRLDSGGGEIILGTVYGNDVTVQSSGGCVEARQIHAQLMAHLSSDGGPITISGFDGNGALVSKGGRVELQLSEHAEEVSIDAADGDVILSISSKLTAQLKYDGARGPVQHEENILTRSEGETGVYDFRGSESGSRGLRYYQGRRGAENDRHGAGAENDSVSCRIVVNTAGKLYVRQKGWLDLI